MTYWINKQKEKLTSQLRKRNVFKNTQKKPVRKDKTAKRKKGNKNIGLVMVQGVARRESIPCFFVTRF